MIKMREAIIKQNLEGIPCVFKYDYYVEGKIHGEIRDDEIQYRGALHDGRIICDFGRIINLNTLKETFLQPVSINHVGILANGDILGIKRDMMYIWDASNVESIKYCTPFAVTSGFYRVFVFENTFITLLQRPHNHLQQWNLTGQCIFEYTKKGINYVLNFLR